MTLPPQPIPVHTAFAATRLKIFSNSAADPIASKLENTKLFVVLNAVIRLSAIVFKILLYALAAASGIYRY